MFENPNKRVSGISAPVVKQVDVFLRTCNQHGIQHPAINRDRCVRDDRSTLVGKCITSLLETIKSSSHDIRLWVIDDHSDTAFLQNLKAQCESFPSQIHALSDTGYLASAIKQLELCRDNGRDLVYLVEDDYFHAPNTIDLMVKALTEVQKSLEWNPVAIYPYDCRDRYQKEFPQPCRIFHIDGLYWRTVTKSTPTVFLKHSTYLQGLPLFEQIARHYHPTELGEDHTINRLWNNMVDMGGPATLISPIPSLAVHLEHQEPTTIRHGLVDWREIYTSYRSLI